jgi:hypothetical protein
MEGICPASRTRASTTRRRWRRCSSPAFPCGRSETPRRVASIKRIASLFCAFALVFTGTLRAALPGGDALGGLITDNFDDNADGLVDRQEWQSGISDSFTTLDADGDGAIVPEEVDALRKDIATQTGDGTATLIVAIIKQVVLFLDTDKDQRVSRDEYEALSVSLFGRLDGDKDGKLARAELATLPMKLIAP